MNMTKKSFWQKITGGIRSSEDYDEYYESDEFEDVYEDEQYIENPPRHARQIQNDIIDEEEYEPQPEIQDTEFMELPVDVFQDAENIYLEAFIPGTSLDSLNIELSRDLITIEGERVSTFDLGEGGSVIYDELEWGKFARSINLPEEVDIDESKAVEVNGTLKVTMPKFNKSRRAKLTVKSLKK